MDKLSVTELKIHPTEKLGRESAEYLIHTYIDAVMQCTWVDIGIKWQNTMVGLGPMPGHPSDADSAS